MTDNTPRRKMIVAVLPAYNEGGHVGRVVRMVQPYVDAVVVVDDGSRDGTAAEAREAGAVVLRHLVNRGAGGGTMTGLKAAVRIGADIVVTLDADGQHKPEDIRKVVEPIERGDADFVIGSRLMNPEGMPKIRLLANRVADICLYVLFGVRVCDSQSGFRAHSRLVIENIDVRTSRFETISEIVVEVARRKFRISHVPIQVIYTEYSMSKGQNFWVGLQTLAKLVLRKVG